MNVVEFGMNMKK